MNNFCSSIYYDPSFYQASYTSSPPDCGGPDGAAEEPPPSMDYGAEAGHTTDPDVDSMMMWLIGHEHAGPDGPYNPTEDDSLVANLMKLLIVETPHPNCG